MKTEFLRPDQPCRRANLETRWGQALQRAMTCGTILTIAMLNGVATSAQEPFLLRNISDGRNGVDIFPAGRHAFIYTYPALWVTDGTTNGTRLLDPDLAKADDCDEDGDQVFVRGELFFLSHESYCNDDWWISDGTERGTRPFRESLDLPENYSTEIPYLVGDRFFFRAAESEHGGELWVSDQDGTGARLVRDIRPGPEGGYPSGLWYCLYGTCHCNPREGCPLSVVGETAYFQADDGEHGLELWVSDGTEAGTTLVRDISPGPIGSGPERLVVVGDLLFFSADDGDHGWELWITDGTEAGTVAFREYLGLGACARILPST